MAGAAITAQFQPPISFILRQSGRFKRALLNLHPLWEMFKPIMGEVEAEQWATHGHGSWPGLAESTLRSKSGSELMVETGALRSSLVDPNAAAQTSAMSMIYGTGVSYAHFHQSGGSIEGRPPVRQVIPDPFPPETRQRFEKAMVTWVNLVAAETWGRI